MMRKKDIDELITEVLQSVHWPEDAARVLAASSHVITYVKGSSIFHAGEPADLLYVLLSGEAKIYYTSPSGERLLVDIACARQALGRLPLPGDDEDAVQGFSAEALSCCSVALITRTRVASMASTLPLKAIGRMAHHQVGEWARLSERALVYLTMDVRGRLGMAIDDISSRFGIADARGTLIPLRLSHEDFGELIGASRPMVSKHLKELADGGVFYKAGGRYVLARREALHARGHERPEPEVQPRPARPRRAQRAVSLHVVHST